MAESEFSWFNMGSSYGFIAFVFLCFALLGYGINTLTSGGEIFFGVISIIGGLICGGLAAWTYINWERKK